MSVTATVIVEIDDDGTKVAREFEFDIGAGLSPRQVVLMMLDSITQAVLELEEKKKTPIH